jgi:hypothetical protein
MKKKAIAVYLDDSDKMEIEFSWLHKTWLLWSLEDEYDLVVYHNPSANERVKKFEGIKTIEMPYMRISDVYKFLNSHYFCLDKEYSKHLKDYEFLMKTDCDVFLTERMRGFIPSKMLVGEGGYYEGSEEKKINYIKSLSKRLKLDYSGLNLVGASFFGRTDHVITLTSNQAILTESILTIYSKEEDFTNSGFQVGISSMIAGEIAVNHMFSNQSLTPHTLDSKCWETAKIGSNILHIHAWHTNKKWSKHSFFRGEYTDWKIDLKDAFINTANYCQFIATISYQELFKLKNLYNLGKFKPNYELLQNKKNDDRFTVIIPTMWKSQRTLNLLRDLNNCDLVDEILVIDNYFIKRPDFNFSKVKILEQVENIYVNPAWNLGIKNANNNLICICNDDINFDVSSTFGFVLENKELLGCFGVHPRSYSSGYESFIIEPGYHTGGGGWGCLMFCKKENWIEIPNSLKIGYGDDWLAITNKPHFSLLHKTKIETEMSTTSSRKEFNSIVSSDIRTWKKIFNK